MHAIGLLSQWLAEHTIIQHRARREALLKLVQALLSGGKRPGANGTCRYPAPGHPRRLVGHEPRAALVSAQGSRRHARTRPHVGRARSELRRRNLLAEPSPLSRARSPDWADWKVLTHCDLTLLPTARRAPRKTIRFSPRWPAQTAAGWLLVTSASPRRRAEIRS